MLKVDVFSPEEVQRLEKRFHKLDLDRSGSISIGEFVSVPELKENPLVKRVVEIFDSDLDGEVDFKEFVMGLDGPCPIQWQRYRGSSPSVHLSYL